MLSLNDIHILPNWFLPINSLSLILPPHKLFIFALFSWCNKYLLCVSNNIFFTFKECSASLYFGGPCFSQISEFFCVITAVSSGMKFASIIMLLSGGVKRSPCVRFWGIQLCNYERERGRRSGASPPVNTTVASRNTRPCPSTTTPMTEHASTICRLRGPRWANPRHA